MATLAYSKTPLEAFRRQTGSDSNMKTKTPNTETLRSVALDVIGDYQRAAKSANATLREGGVQGIAKVDKAIDGLAKYESQVTQKSRTLWRLRARRWRRPPTSPAAPPPRD